MLGTGLMLVGVILIVIAFLGLFTGICGAIASAVLLVVRTIMNVLFHMFNETQISSEYSQYMNDKKASEQLAEETREMIKQKEREDKRNNTIKEAVSIKIAEFKATYPNADKHLFDEYIREFTSGTMARTKDVEKRIRESHVKNSCRNAKNNYTVDMLKNYKSIGLIYNHDMTMTLYKHGNDYILHVKSANEDIIFTSHNKRLMEHAMNNIDMAMDNVFAKDHDFKHLNREQVENAFAKAVNQNN